MPVACPTCQAVICESPDDTTLYDLEGPIFPFVLNCPPGFFCNSDSFKMVCCGTLLSVDFPNNADTDTKTALITGIVNQCKVLLSACGQNPGCLNPPCNPPPPTIQLFYNQPATCSIPCPDGTVFFYTVPAGTFAALTQAEADQEALDYACQQVALRRACMGQFPPCGCVGTFLAVHIPVSGGIPPISFVLSSGSLPDGLQMSLAGIISGTPTTPGQFSFSVTAVTGDGGFVQKTFQMSILQIITTSPLPFPTIGVPYYQQLLAAGGSGNYKWRIVSGTLPSGLSMDNNGLISGTPT